MEAQYIRGLVEGVVLGLSAGFFLAHWLVSDHRQVMAQVRDALAKLPAVAGEVGAVAGAVAALPLPAPVRVAAGLVAEDAAVVTKLAK